MNDSIILYESYHGKSMTCNPYALFLTMLDDNRFQNFMHIWILTDANVKRYKELPNVKIVKRNSIKHAYYLVKAKYLINNTTFLPYINIKKEQVYINTWHGTPLKTLGKDVKFSYGNSKNVCKNLLQTDFFISPNSYTTKYFLESNDVDNLYSGKIVENGYPRNDLLFLDEKMKHSLYEELNLDRTKEVLLYAPTFRGSHINAESFDGVLLDFIKLLEEKFSDRYNIVTKLHHINTKDNLEFKSIPSNYDTNQILGITDILITDYSSIAFDFLLLQKPILYYVIDLDEYIQNRGLYFNIYDMPGVVCKTKSNVIVELNNIDSFMQINKTKYSKAIDTFCQYDDGNISRKIIDAVFFNDRADINIFKIVNNNKKKILIYGGAFLNNGVSASLIALLQNLSYEKFEVYLVSTIDVNTENFLRTIKRIPKKVKIIYIHESGTKLLQPLFDKMSIKHLEKVFIKENYSFFGNTKFDVAIDYSGYGSYWASIIAFSNASKKCIYLHSDMKKENEIRGHLLEYDYLNKLYEDKFDKLITVSESSYEANSENYLFLKNKIITVDNPINSTRIIELSQKDDFETIPNRINFINIGRYSVEKAQTRLLKAFKELSLEYGNIHLYLVGHGPLEGELNSLIAEYELQKYVTMTGSLENPFSLLKQCDCFILSSYYEGQGLVLLEALVLGVPCISTNIDGPQSILSEEQGLLVEDSIEGLVFGMEEFIKGRVPLQCFDANKYTRNAMESFYQAIT